MHRGFDLGSEEAESKKFVLSHIVISLGYLLRVCELGGGNEAWFLRSVEDLWPEYFWFLVDWMFERDRTMIRVVEDGGTLLGASLVYDHKIVHFRGELGACRALLESLKEEKVEINAPLEMKEELLRRFHPKVDFNIVLMTMGRGGLKPRCAYEWETLVPEDASDIALLLNQADPKWWGDMSEERVRAMFNKSYWIGIRDGGSLKAVGSVLTQGPGFNISIIATEMGSRGKGYATTIVSVLAERILREVPYAVIHVREDNHAARSVYENVGFRPYKSFYILRGERII